MSENAEKLFRIPVSCNQEFVTKPNKSKQSFFAAKTKQNRVVCRRLFSEAIHILKNILKQFGQIIVMTQTH